MTYLHVTKLLSHHCPLTLQIPWRNNNPSSPPSNSSRSSMLETTVWFPVFFPKYSSLPKVEPFTLFYFKILSPSEQTNNRQGFLGHIICFFSYLSCRGQQPTHQGDLEASSSNLLLVKVSISQPQNQHQHHQLLPVSMDAVALFRCSSPCVLYPWFSRYGVSVCDCLRPYNAVYYVFFFVTFGYQLQLTSAFLTLKI